MKHPSLVLSVATVALLSFALRSDGRASSSASSSQQTVPKVLSKADLKHFPLVPEHTRPMSDCLAERYQRLAKVRTHLATIAAGDELERQYARAKAELVSGKALEEAKCAP
ncbi:MAG: hypothetical protein JNL79_03125 [Myxococcales bacterium]|nr:hypothetical protein [Myxococcales bacterium]